MNSAGDYLEKLKTDIVSIQVEIEKGGKQKQQLINYKIYVELLKTLSEFIFSEYNILSGKYEPLAQQLKLKDKKIHQLQSYSREYYKKNKDLIKQKYRDKLNKSKNGISAEKLY